MVVNGVKEKLLCTAEKSYGQWERQKVGGLRRERNIIVDKVVRHWLTMAINDDGTVAADGFGMQVSQKLAMFYADDGFTASWDHNWLQHAMDALVALFGQMGLQANVAKTQTMTCYPG